MTPVLLLLLTPDTQSNALFDRAIQHITQASKGTFTAEFRSTQNAVKKSGSYGVAYVRPDRLQVRARVEGDRTYTLIGTKLYAVDHRAGEYLSVAAGNTGSATQKMGAVVAVDEPVRILVDPGVGKSFLSTFREISAWRIDRTTDGATLYAKDVNGGYTIGFDASGRLQNVRVESRAGWLEWSYRYGSAPKAITFAPPPGYKRVNEFIDTDTTDRGLPTYADAQAKRIVDGTLRAYSRLTSVAYTVIDEAGSTTVWVSGKAVRQKSAAGEWAWRNGILTVVQHRQKTIRTGKANWRTVDGTVGKLAQRVDPILSRLERKENPVLEMLGADMKGRSIGTLKFGRVTCDVVEFKAPGLRLTLTIRRDNRLLHAASTENLDGTGRVMGRSERRYTYSSWNVPLGATTFSLTLPKGYKRTGL